MALSIKIITIIGLGYIAAANGLNVGLISDLHLHLRYDPQWGPYEDREGGCMKKMGTEEPLKAPMGRYGCDSPTILIETMLDELKRLHGDLDVIVLTGDSVAH